MPRPFNMIAWRRVGKSGGFACAARFLLVRREPIAYSSRMPIAALSDEEIRSRLAERPGWEHRGDRIARTFRFGSFAEAFGWMTSVAIVADKLDHHPEWRNVYSRVEVELTTHDAGGLSERDFTLARAMDELAGSDA